MRALPQFLFTISPSSLPHTCFLPSKDCKDLLQRMLHGGPFARASLDEVLNHLWMNSDPPELRCPSTCLVDADVPEYAVLECISQVNRNWVNILAELEAKMGTMHGGILPML